MTASNPNRVRNLLLAAGALIVSPLAYAHHPMGGATPGSFTEGLLSGIGHPIIGPDHLAFLIVAALLTATLSGRSFWLFPLAFIGATAAGAIYHLGAAGLPMAEVVIALSVLLGGLAIFARKALPLVVLGALFTVAGVFHGYAYGEAIIGAENTPLLAYLAGFSLTQYAIITLGAQGFNRLSQGVQAKVTRYGAGAASVGGVLLLGLQLT